MSAWHQIYSSGPNATLRPHEVRTRIRGHGSAIINEGLHIQETEYNDNADPGVIHPVDGCITSNLSKQTNVKKNKLFVSKNKQATFSAAQAPKRKG